MNGMAIWQEIEDASKTLECAQDWLIDIKRGLELTQRLCYDRSRRAGWWTNLETGASLVRNRPEMLMLMVSEIAECMEGVRKNAMDTHLPHRKMEEVELADAIIRILDYAGGFNLDVAGALIEKLVYNANRADHKIEARKAGGKAF